MSNQCFDYLILGSGIAGLSLALDLAQHGTVAIVTKKNRAESNTNYAQGGIACVTSAEDTFELHVKDTLEAGAGLCQEKVVRAIIQEGPGCVKKLINLGMSFTERDSLESNGKRELDLTKEGGHSKRRVLHAKDVTGREIENALLHAIENHPNIQIFENHFAINLTTTHDLKLSGVNQCLGAYVFERDTQKVLTFQATATILATGGCGKVYLYTTNPDIATGDGVAMAYRSGAHIANMEFVQFHPTCLYHPEAKSFLISEAVRGEGGKLLHANGETFMERYDSRQELAPRDIVARAIDAEMKRTGEDCVYLDISHKDKDFILKHFPNIYHTCLQYGIDITQQPIPVVPAAHYQCGGVITEIDGSTNISHLYAIGEVACTGLHGANRLASNSLLEAMVVAHQAAQTIPPLKRYSQKIQIPAWESSNVSDPDELVVVSHNWDEIRRLMWDYVGIVRTTKRLQRAASRLKNLDREIQEFYWNFKLTSDLLELRNLALVAQLIVQCALKRKESRGLHYTLDYPKTKSIAKDSIIFLENP